MIIKPKFKVPPEFAMSCIDQGMVTRLIQVNRTKTGADTPAGAFSKHSNLSRTKTGADTPAGAYSYETSGGAPALPYMTNLALWVDAEDSTITGDPDITQWTDLSGNNRHLTQDTATHYPQKTTLGAWIAVQFDGTADHFEITSGIPHGDFTVIAVVQIANTATVRTVIGGDTNAFQFRFNAGENLCMAKTGIDIVYSNCYATDCPDGAIEIVAGKWDDAAAYKFWINGAADGNGATALDVSANTTYVGKSMTAATELFSGYLLALAVYTEYLSDANVTAVMDYYNAIYSVY